MNRETRSQRAEPKSDGIQAGTHVTVVSNDNLMLAYKTTPASVRQVSSQAICVIP